MSSVSALSHPAGKHRFSRPNSEIRFLLLENIHSNALEILRDAGFSAFDTHNKALPEDELIERLQEDEHRRETGEVGSGPHAAPVPSSPAPVRRQSSPRAPAADPALRGFSDDRLAAELQRRGWIVVEP